MAQQINLTDNQRERIQKAMADSLNRYNAHRNSANDSTKSARETGDASGFAAGVMFTLETLGIPYTITETGEFNF